MSIQKLAIIVIATLFSQTAHANLIVNGSFEDNGATLTGTTNIIGWNVTRGNVDTRGGLVGGSRATDGTWLLDLAGFTGGTIRQTVSGLEIGKWYGFSFDLGSNTTNNRLYLALNDAFDLSTNILGRPGPLVTQYFEFRAKTSVFNVQFQDRGIDAGGPALDNIQLDRVPEAGQITLFLSGLLLLLIARRRQKFPALFK